MAKHTPEYSAWSNMLTRCRNPKFKHFANYGGRGIKVCERWLRFENFLADMGQRPSAEHSLDRIDNDGDYQPGNCRWAVRVVQGGNKRSNRVITFLDRTQHVAAWARDTGLHVQTILFRLRSGWGVEDALTVEKWGKPRTDIEHGSDGRFVRLENGDG